MPVPFLPEAELVLVCDLAGSNDVPRMPPRIWRKRRCSRGFRFPP